MPRVGGGGGEVEVRDRDRETENIGEREGERQRQPYEIDAEYVRACILYVCRGEKRERQADRQRREGGAVDEQSMRGCA